MYPDYFRFASIFNLYMKDTFMNLFKIMINELSYYIVGTINTLARLIKPAQFYFIQIPTATIRSIHLVIEVYMLRPT